MSDTATWAGDIVAGAAFVLAGWSVWYSRRAANGTRDQADEARRQREQNATELHRLRQPKARATDPTYEPSADGGTQYFVNIAMSADCFLRIDFMTGGDVIPSPQFDLRTPAEVPYRVRVGAVRPAGIHSRATLQFRVWPVDTAPCDCGREPAYDSGGGHGHWTQSVLVEWPQPEPDIKQTLG